MDKQELQIAVKKLKDIVDMSRILTVVILILALGIQLLNSQRAVAAPPVSKETELHRIVAGIKHFRTTLPNVSVKMTCRDGRLAAPGTPSPAPTVDHSPNKAHPVELLRPDNDDTKIEADMPDNFSAVVYWISRGRNLSADVKYEGNLDSDHGDKTWVPVRERLVLANGNASTISQYRMRVPNNKGSYSERLAWSGKINSRKVFDHDGIQAEYPYLDPRYFIYTEDGTPLDNVFTDPRFRISIKAYERIYGSKCALIEQVFTPSSGQILTSNFWIDLDHDFILRKETSRVGSSKDAKGKLVMFTEVDVPGLQHMGSCWLPVKYTQRQYVNVTSPAGKQSVVKLSDVTSFQPIPTDYEYLASPFKIKWPVGIYVNNYIRNKRYVAEKPGRLKDVTNVKDNSCCDATPPSN